MEASELIPLLEAEVPGGVLEIRPFGRSGQISVWVEMSKLKRLAHTLCTHADLGFDWLENFSVFEVEGALVFTYFLRSTQGGRELILRGSSIPESDDAVVRVPSVTEPWPMAARLEMEASSLFGIYFENSTAELPGLLPKGWHGFPLRKTYIFPAQVEGVLHMRPVGRTIPDEHEVPG